MIVWWRTSPPGRIPPKVSSEVPEGVSYGKEGNSTSMTNTLEEFNAKFRVEELLVERSEYWAWSVRPVQATLGAGVLSLRRFCQAMGAVSPEEMTDLAVITRTLEDRLAQTFAPQKMNYLMLMMVDAHLHFHVLPRYARPVQFAGASWADEGWPGPSDLGSGVAEDALLSAIREALAARRPC